MLSVDGVPGIDEKNENSDNCDFPLFCLIPVIVTLHYFSLSVCFLQNCQKG